MHYEAAVTSQDLLELTYNSKEVSENLWVSELPTYHESIGYELRGSILVVKYEQTEDERIAYNSNMSYSLQAVPPVIALACAMHKRRFVQLGTSRHTIHVAVNHPEGAYIAKKDHVGQTVIKHASKGLIFVKNQDFYEALEDRLVAQLYVDRMGLSIGNLIPNAYLVRFELNGKFLYFPASHAFTEKAIRDSYLTREEQDLEWDLKRNEIEHFVEEWTK
jgi:hypothetical protein